MNNKIFLVFLAVLFALTIFPLNAFALTYDSVSDNGNWFEYVGGLDSEYYKEDILKATENRDFDTNWDNLTNNGECNAYYCVYTGCFRSDKRDFFRSSDWSSSGSYSAYFGYQVFAGASGPCYNRIKFLGTFADSNTSFSYNVVAMDSGDNAIFKGKINDSNDWVWLDTYPYASLSVGENEEFIIFDSNLEERLGFNNQASSGNTYMYIDDVEITRNNAGTFYQGDSAPFCSSKETCSNIDDSADLNNNEVTNLYWVLDYVAGASCSVIENGGLPVSAVEMSNGYFYHEIQTLGSDAGTDLNLRATCDKVPFSTKGFAVNLDLGTAGEIDSTLSVGNSGTGNVAYRGNLVSFYAEYDAGGDPITSADCNIKIASNTYDLAYNSVTGRYEYSQYFIDNGVYSVYTTCESDTYTDRNSTYNLTITDPLSDTLVFTAISNIGDYSINDSTNVISITKSPSADSFSFSLLSSASNSISFSWNDQREQKQYYIYTSSDGVTWTFNDSYTFGSGDYNSVLQKILLNSNQYNYSFDDSISASQTKYYRFVYKDVARYWETINSSLDWIKNSLVTNTRDYSLLADYDLINDSNYSNVEILSNDYYPELTSSDFNAGVEFQFTAYASSETSLKVGFKTDDGVETTYTVNVGTSPQKYSVPINADDFDSRIFITSDETTSVRVYVRDYVIVPKAYFISRLNVYDGVGDELSAILNNGSSVIYAQEGENLIFNTKAYDFTGDLATLRVEALVNGIVVNSKDFSLPNTLNYINDTYEWNEELIGVIDRNGYYNNPSTFRDLTFRAILINNVGQEVSEQFKTIKLMPYPYFSNDLDLFISPLTNKVGENPKFRVTLNQRLPEQFRGFRVRLWDSSSSLASPDYDEYIYNDVLNCGANCSKDLVLDDFVFETEDNYKAQFTVLLGTEVENTDNILTNYVSSFYVTYKDFETSRLFQAFERSDHTYRNDEPIPIVLQLRDIPYINLKDRTEVYLTLDLCSGSTGACDTNGTTKFYPKFHYYDASSGYNYYYWNDLFYKDSGDLLEDSNYIRFKANILDQYYSHDDAELPTATLGDKCADVDFNDIGSFLYNFFLSSVTGCTTPASSIIEIGDAEEERILIDSDHSVTGSPNQSLVCVKPNNTSYINTFKQDLFCGVIYKRGELAIDYFNVKIGNDATDWTKKGVEKQFLEFTIPVENVLFNDPFLLKQALNNEYATDEINTVGELFFYSVDDLFTGIANPLTEIPTALTDTGVIKNINWDFNWDNTLDPTYVTGLFFFNIEGLDTINQYDYIGLFPELELLNPKEFRAFAIRNKIPLAKKETIVSVYASDLKQVERFKTDSPLVIFAKPSENNVDPNVTDQNLSTRALPRQFNFTLLSDMSYGNGRYFNRVQIPLTLSNIIGSPFNLSSLISSANEFINNPLDWFKQNWFILFIILTFGVVVSLVYYNFKGNKG